jgi:hypothetical protein
MKFHVEDKFLVLSRMGFAANHFSALSAQVEEYKIFYCQKVVIRFDRI